MKRLIWQPIVHFWQHLQLMDAKCFCLFWRQRRKWRQMMNILRGPPLPSSSSLSSLSSSYISYFCWKCVFCVCILSPIVNLLYHRPTNFTTFLGNKLLHARNCLKQNVNFGIDTRWYNFKKNLTNVSLRVCRKWWNVIFFLTYLYFFIP